MVDNILFYTAFSAISIIALLVIMGLYCWHARRFRRMANWLDRAVDKAVDSVFKYASNHIGISSVDLSQSELPTIITIRDGDDELWSGHFYQGITIEINNEIN